MGSRHDRRARGLLARDGTDLSARPILIGDHIENPGNVDCLRAAAAMFDCAYGNAGDHDAESAIARGLPIIALENARGADDIFKVRPPDTPFALVVGNERNGISRALLRRADRVVQIPVAAGTAQVNCLNVAAAAAVALARLARQGGQRTTRGGRGEARPHIVLAGVDDPIELGSAVRSATCFGWTEVHIVDRDGVWFDTDRVTRSLGRGAARRARNPIRVRHGVDPAAFDDVCVIDTAGGEPVRRADLARGPRQLIVIGDPRALAPCGAVRKIRLDVEPHARAPLRLVASIALAEIARQVGRPA